MSTESPPEQSAVARAAAESVARQLAERVPMADHLLRQIVDWIPKRAPQDR